ncbi:hypothetical protein ACJX0J_008535 [Zea mays]
MKKHNGSLHTPMQFILRPAAKVSNSHMWLSHGMSYSQIHVTVNKRGTSKQESRIQIFHKKWKQHAYENFLIPLEYGYLGLVTFGSVISARPYPSWQTTNMHSLPQIFQENHVLRIAALAQIVYYLELSKGDQDHHLLCFSVVNRKQVHDINQVELLFYKIKWTSYVWRGTLQFSL